MQGGFGSQISATANVGRGQFRSRQDTASPMGSGPSSPNTRVGVIMPLCGFSPREWEVTTTHHLVPPWGICKGQCITHGRAWLAMRLARGGWPREGKIPRRFLGLKMARQDAGGRDTPGQSSQIDVYELGAYLPAEHDNLVPSPAHTNPTTRNGWMSVDGMRLRKDRQMGLVAWRGWHARRIASLPKSTTPNTMDPFPKQKQTGRSCNPQPARD